MTDTLDPRAARRLAVLLQLSARARDAASPAELGFVVVNETLGAVPYRQAALWIEGRGIVAVSGIPTIDAGTPFVQWLDRIGPALRASGRTETLMPADLAPADAEEWTEWLPAHAVRIPLGSAATAPGAVLLARDEPFTDAEQATLAHLAGAYGHAWRALQRPSRLTGLRERLKTLSTRKRVLAAAFAALALLFPVRLSILAPAETVPANPVLVRAPLDGVVDVIHVRPNDAVEKGRLLFELDATALRARLEVAEQALAGVEAEYRQAVQAAVRDPRAKAQLAIIGGRIEEKRAEADFVRGQLERARVSAPAAGIVIFDDPSAWLGRPVSLGERVMTITGETESEIEAWPAPGDIIPLKAGAPVTLFLNAAPLSPVSGSLRTLGYEAQTRPEGTLAYRLRASVDPQVDKPRVGLKGTARIDGDRVVLIYWIFRKPLAVVRQWLGA